MMWLCGYRVCNCVAVCTRGRNRYGTHAVRARQPCKIFLSRVVGMITGARAGAWDAHVTVFSRVGPGVMRYLCLLWPGGRSDGPRMPSALAVACLASVSVSVCVCGCGSSNLARFSIHVIRCSKANTCMFTFIYTRLH